MFVLSIVALTFQLLNILLILNYVAKKLVGEFHS